MVLPSLPPPPHQPKSPKPNIQPPGIVKAVSKSLGKEPKMVLYSPEEVGTGKGGKAEGFPFRCAREGGHDAACCIAVPVNRGLAPARAACRRLAPRGAFF